jgi:hypothetical protein
MLKTNKTLKEKAEKEATNLAKRVKRRERKKDPKPSAGQKRKRKKTQIKQDIRDDMMLRKWLKTITSRAKTFCSIKLIMYLARASVLGPTAKIFGHVLNSLPDYALE